MFSLCIPTMNRYDNFLSEFLPRYINNELIDEIIISDENGNDAEKISKRFESVPKIKLHVNKQLLGAFLNKITACKYAKNQWIALIDSDNFADIDYFTLAQNKINKMNYQEETIIAPYYPLGIKFFEDLILNKNNIRNLTEKRKLGKFINTGNFILNKYLTDNIKLIPEMTEFKDHGYDVYHFYMIIFEQYEKLNIHVYKDLKYTHNFSDDGYVKICTSSDMNKFHEANNILNEKFNKLGS